MLRKVVGAAARDAGQMKTVLARKCYGLWQGLWLYYLVLNSGSGGRKHLPCKVQMAESSTTLDKARRLLCVLWSQRGLTGAHILELRDRRRLEVAGAISSLDSLCQTLECPTLLPVTAFLLINWCPGTEAAHWDHANEGRGSAKHLAGPCFLGGHLLKWMSPPSPFALFLCKYWKCLIIMTKSLKSSWPIFSSLSPQTKQSQLIFILWRSGGDKGTLKNPPQKTRRGNQLLFYIYFIFSLNKGLLFFSLPTTKLIDLFIKFSKFRHQTDVFLPLPILFLAALT